MNDPFDAYLHRFARAALCLPPLNPACPQDRQAIRDRAAACLGMRDQWVPQMEVQVVGQVELGAVTAYRLVAQSWLGVTATANLFAPSSQANASLAEPLPGVLLCCGHGVGGKLNPGYQSMALHLAAMGAVVLCHDNIGQGERTPMGHRDAVGPFACGTSLQGLIVMEAMGWLDWLKQHPQVDRSRLAAIGNSGGGTLTVFLAAMRDDLAVISSSGYPCTFDFIARKEKQHCHCNILPGIVGRLEMWQLLGCAAPRPLLIFQGRGDPLFPPDLFHHTARKIAMVYQQTDARERFDFRLVDGGHPWDAGRLELLGQFLKETLGLTPSSAQPVTMLTQPAEQLRCLSDWPSGALDVNQLAKQLTGRAFDPGMQLWDVYRPVGIDLSCPHHLSHRGDTRQIFAQYEAFLGPES